MKAYKVFGQNKQTGGNLMAVVNRPENALDSGFPVTVLIEASKAADVKFRFFYPDSLEASICGHALLGAAHSVDALHFDVETGSGVREVRKLGASTLVNFGAFEEIRPNFTTQPQSIWFNLQPENIIRHGIFSAGKPKLMIEVDSLATLNIVQFDLEALLAWNRGKNFSGYTLFTHDKGQLYARASNPLYNIPEDSACAVCCAALPVTCLEQRSIHMGHPHYPNTLHLEEKDGSRWVGGNVFPV